MDTADDPRIDAATARASGRDSLPKRGCIRTPAAGSSGNGCCAEADIEAEAIEPETASGAEREGGAII